MKKIIIILGMLLVGFSGAAVLTVQTNATNGTVVSPGSGNVINFVPGTSGTLQVNGVAVTGGGGSGTAPFNISNFTAQSILAGNNTSVARILGPVNNSLAGWNGTGILTNITLGANLSLTGNVLDSTGGITGVVPIANGGTNGTTVGAALTNLQIAKQTIVSGSTYNVLSTDSEILTTASSGNQNINLASAASYTAGYVITISDSIGNLSIANETIINVNSGDTIANGITQLKMESPFDSVSLVSDGVSNWRISKYSAITSSSMNFGDQASAGAQHTINMGFGAVVGNDSVNIGYNQNQGTGSQLVAIGYASRAGGQSVAIGEGAGAGVSPLATQEVNIGYGAGPSEVGQTGIINIGWEAAQEGAYPRGGIGGVNVGYNSHAFSEASVGIGAEVQTGDHDAVAIGSFAATQHAQSTAIGSTAIAWIQNELSIGGQATELGTTAGNQLDWVGRNTIRPFNSFASRYFFNTGHGNSYAVGPYNINAANSPIIMRGVSGLDASTNITAHGTGGASGSGEFQGIGEVAANGTITAVTILDTCLYASNLTFTASGNSSATGFVGVAVNGTFAGLAGRVNAVTISSGGSNYIPTLHNRAGGDLWISGGEGTGTSVSGNIVTQVTLAGGSSNNIPNTWYNATVVSPTNDTSQPALFKVFGNTIVTGNSTVNGTLNVNSNAFSVNGTILGNDTNRLVTSHDVLNYTLPITSYDSGNAYVIGPGLPGVVGVATNATLTINGSTTKGPLVVKSEWSSLFINTAPDGTASNEKVSNLNMLATGNQTANGLGLNVPPSTWSGNWGAGNMAQATGNSTATNFNVFNLSYTNFPPDGSGNPIRNVFFGYNRVGMYLQCPFAFPDGPFYYNIKPPVFMIAQQTGTAYGAASNSARYLLGEEANDNHQIFNQYWFSSGGEGVAGAADHGQQMMLEDSDSSHEWTALTLYGLFNDVNSWGGFQSVDQQGRYVRMLTQPSNANPFSGQWGLIPASASWLESNEANGLYVGASTAGGTLHFFTGGIHDASYDRGHIEDGGWVLGSTSSTRVANMTLTVDGNETVNGTISIGGTGPFLAQDFALINGSGSIHRASFSGPALPWAMFNGTATSLTSSNNTLVGWDSTGNLTNVPMEVTISANIDAKTTGNTTIYTPSSGKNFIVTSAQIENMVTTAVTVPAQMTLSAGGTANNVSAALTVTTPSAGQYFPMSLAAQPFVCTSAAPATLRITVGSTATTHTIKVILTGIEQ